MLFRHNFDSILNDLFIETVNNSTLSGPSSNVETNDKDYTISLAIPGIDPAEVSVEFDRSENKLDIAYKGEGNEFVGKFKKSYKVPSTVDYDAIEADTDRGILTLTLPKKSDQTKIKIM